MIQIRTALTVAATLCALAVPTSMHAQDRSQSGPVADLSLEQLLNVEVDEVFGASRYRQRVVDAPASVTIVTHEEIERFGYRTLADILRGVRGFYVSNDRNYSYLGTRGFSRPGDYNTRVLVLIDGHRLNESIYDGVYIGTEFPIHIDLIERVEVVRGPSSSLYGTNALFGVVNVVTRRASALPSGRAAVDVGTLGTRAGSASYGLQSATRGDFLFGASAYASEGESMVTVPGYGVARDMDDDEAVSLFGSWQRNKWSMQATYASRDKRIPTGAFGIALDDRRSRTEDNRGYLALSYDGTWRGNGVAWKASYDHYAYRGLYAYPGEAEGEMGLVSLDRASTDWAQTDIMLTRRVARRHFLTGGVEYRHHFRERQRTETVDPFELFLLSETSSKVFAAYLQDEFTITPHLTVSAGVRHDVSTQWDGSTNLRLAGIYKPSSNSAFKVLHGSAFRAPNPYELYYYDNPFPLVPERIRTTEFVWEQYARRHLRMTVSAFVYRMRDLISQVPVDTPDGFVFENLEAAKASGIEFEAERSWRDLNVVGSYTYQHARGDDERTLSNSPRHLVRARATGPVMGRWLFFGAEALYTGDRGTLGGAVAPGGLLGNLTVTSRELGRARLSLTIGNLFDRAYTDPGAAEHPSDLITQPGRTIRAKLAWRF
jgi:iron complex outermembrane receptor protein